MRMFDYVKPETIEEALSLLNRYGEGALPIGGGTDVVLMIKKKNIFPEVLVSLQGLSDLKRISLDGALTIGPMTTHRAIEKSGLIRRHFPALTDAEDVLGSVQIRNVGTIGGNICTAAPSADTAPPLLVLGTRVKTASLGGGRTVPLEDFFTGPGKTVLKPGEIVTELTIPQPLPYSSSAYWKHQRRLALDLPILGVAVMLSLDRKTISDPGCLKRTIPPASIVASLEKEKLICKDIRIALGVAAPVPMRALQAEQVMKGQAITAQLLEEAARTASEEAKPRDSVRGEAWYRKEMIKVFVKRMVLTCVERIVNGDNAVTGNG